MYSLTRMIACLCVLALTPTAAMCAPRSSPVAPADEYFGKLKMSILGIRNTIRDVGANIDVDPGRWSGLINKADFTEDAVHDWQSKYPRDTWLPKTVFALAHMYAKVDSEEARKRSFSAMIWLVHDFPNTCFGKIGKEELARGRVGAPAPVGDAAGHVCEAR
ncbi:MAG: hypothetical protein NVSMB64_14730 [Candidatus Velthaea sp.]